MRVARAKISTTLTWFAGSIALLVAAAVPLTYLIASYAGMSATLTARAEGFAVALNRLVSAAPDLWQYQHYRLEVQLQRLVMPLSTEHARVYDADGQVVVEVGAVPKRPVIMRSALLYDSGRPVGRVEVSDTLRDLLWEGAAADIVGTLLAIGVFVTLRSLPLRALDRALDEAESRRVMLMEAQRIARMGSWEYELASRTLTGSDHLFHLLGAAPPLWPFAKSLWARMNADDRRPVRDAINAWLSGVEHPAVEFRIRTASGLGHVMLARCEITREPDGTPRALRGTVLDITEQKSVQDEIRRLNAELEQRVQERTSELRQTVSELEAFSYSVAHDLRAPIRSINSFMHLLLRAPGTVLDAGGARYAERILGASGKMAALIDGLLDLARMSRTELRLTCVDVSGMARGLVERMEKAQPQRAVRIHVDDGLTAMADARLMHSVLAQLIDNAWKFTAHTPEAYIELRGVEEPEKGRCAFVIRDNGVGFDMRYAHKLFEAFQRLHHAEDYPGAGIGLVMVRRIVERHGGSVRVRSEVGKGTEVYFTV